MGVKAVSRDFSAVRHLFVCFCAINYNSPTIIISTFYRLFKIQPQNLRRFFQSHCVLPFIKNFKNYPFFFGKRIFARFGKTNRRAFPDFSAFRTFKTETKTVGIRTIDKLLFDYAFHEFCLLSLTLYYY